MYYYKTAKIAYNSVGVFDHTHWYKYLISMGLNIWQREVTPDKDFFFQFKILISVAECVWWKQCLLKFLEV